MVSFCRIFISSMFWSKPALILMMIWTCGNAIIIYLAGLQDIPDSLYESAALDGAGFIRQTIMIDTVTAIKVVMGTPRITI